MFADLSRRRQLIIITLIVLVVLIPAYYYRVWLWETFTSFGTFITDKEQIENFISSFGWGAPLVFIGFQILQVILAPFPGEITGAIGGYLFGTLKGFIFSTAGLTVGSWINFIIGRFLGQRYVRKLIPPKQTERMDAILKRQGTLVIFILFLFPGFPKDYLCLFLGITSIAPKLFLILSAVGRMPGTFLLSLQGGALSDKQYGLFFIVLSVCTVGLILIFRYRENLYRWMERYQN
ncbi:TVP38/TMEM64 family protein [Desulfococcaceae bacterium HSG7]|nr:TVP38/TMEM64 family protein [Desulfococcaceae bacterium HSG7]